MDGHPFEGRYQVLDHADRAWSGPTASTKSSPRSQQPRIHEKARADRKTRGNRGGRAPRRLCGPGVEDKMGTARGAGPLGSSFKLMGPAPGTRILIGLQKEGPASGFRSRLPERIKACSGTKELDGGGRTSQLGRGPEVGRKRMLESRLASNRNAPVPERQPVQAQHHQPTAPPCAFKGQCRLTPRHRRRCRSLERAFIRIEV